MAETRQSIWWKWSWASGVVFAGAAFCIWYHSYDMSTECAWPVARCQTGQIVPAGSSGGSLPWQALAGAEIMACFSGICFAWFVIHLLGPGKATPETPRTGSEGKSPLRLFATRAARIQTQLDVVKDKSKAQRATVLAIRAAKARATEEAALAQVGRKKAARDLAQEADKIAPAMIKELQKQFYPTAGHALQSAKEHFRQQQMEWTDEHAAQFKDIMADINLANLGAGASAEFVQAAKAKAEKTPMAADDSEAAAHALADAIAKALGGNAG